MKKYVLGFAFTPDLENVLLLKKTKPKWQEGKYNGLGGKMKTFETPVEAMVREFKEEADIETIESDWHPVGKLSGLGGNNIDEDWDVYIFFAKINIPHLYLSDEGQTKDFPVKKLPTNEEQITNLNWIINASRDPNVWIGKVYIVGSYA